MASLDYAGYIFDLDGTIYLGDELLPGAAELISKLTASGKTVRFLSNNPTKDPKQYVEKLHRLGIETTLGNVVNTVVTTRNWLLAHHPDAKLLVLGPEALQQDLVRAGFKLTEDAAETDVVVASYDRSFDYRKLQLAFDALWFHRRAILIQTNPDRFCPMPGGRGEPDCAAITAAISACTQVECSASLGKPSPLMLDAALHGTELTPKNCLMVGDRLHTDIKMAADAGMDSVLVLTGESTQADVAAAALTDRPTWVLPTAADLLDQLA